MLPMSKTLILKKPQFRSGQALRHNSGQAMLLTVIALGGTLLGATTIAGLLMLHQIRQSTDLRDSNKAIFAADAGIELANYTLRFPNAIVPASLDMTDQNGIGNGAKIDKIVCYSTDIDPGPDDIIDPCKDDGTNFPAVIRSYGAAGRANRAFEQ